MSRERSREAGIPAGNVGAGVGISEEEQRAAPVLEEVGGELLGARGVLGGEAVDHLAGLAGQGEQRLGRRELGNGGVVEVGAEDGDRVDARHELADGAARVGLALRDDDDDAESEFGGAGLEAHEQLGVVGAAEFGKDETEQFVARDGEAAGGAEGHVVELVGGGEDALPGALGDGARALEDARDGGDGDPGGGGDGVDRRALGGGCSSSHQRVLLRLVVESGESVGRRRVNSCKRLQRLRAIVHQNAGSGKGQRPVWGWQRLGDKHAGRPGMALGCDHQSRGPRPLSSGRCQ